MIIHGALISAAVRTQTPGQVSDSYHTAASLLALTPEQAKREFPVRVRGVVTWKASNYISLIVQDGTAGIWVYLEHPAELSQGDEVEVVGHVSEGLFSPVVYGNTISRLGRTALPKPRDVTFKQLSTGGMDCQFVSVTGLVRSAGVGYGESRLHLPSLRIAMKDGVVDAILPAEDASGVDRLIGAVVRVDAAATAIKNENRQIIAPALSVDGIHNVTVLRPPPQDLFAQHLMRLGNVMQYRSGTDYWHSVRVAGIVTYYIPGESLYLEDKGLALFVKTRQVDQINPGDRVEVVGYPASHDSGPILEDAIFRRIGAGEPPQPTQVSVADLSTGTLNNVLVSVKGTLLRRVREPSSDVLLLQDKADIVLAELSHTGASDPLRNLREGSSIMISGISILEVEGTWNYGVDSAHAVRCKLLIRSPSDVKAIGPPTWWTIRHMFYISALLGILVIAFLAQVVRGRIEQWRLKAVHKERERLANEIHDTLAQSFAGIGFQLQAIRKVIPNDMSDLRQQVDLARDLVRHSHKEARRSIEQLDPGLPEKEDLLSSLTAAARAMVEGGSVNVVTASTGNPRPIPLRIANGLMRIGREAIANAVRHADPSNLSILLHYESESVRLTIQDDGIGFVKSGDLLGFGLRGMRNRAADISAILEIDSQPQHGTRIVATAPLPAEATMASSLKHTFKYISERTYHANEEPQSNPDSDCR
jgi:signal transduction histidine kinase